MSWGSSAQGFVDLLQTKSPEYRKEQEWKKESREMERQKFAETMKQAKLEREKAAAEAALKQQQAKELEAENDFKTRYDEYMSMVRETEEFLASSGTDEDLRKGVQRLGAKYGGRPEFLEAIKSGSTAPMMRNAAEMERFGLQREYLKAGPQRHQVVDSSGKLNTLPKSSPLYKRDLTEDEREVLATMPELEFGSEDFNEAVRLQANGAFEKVTVYEPSTGRPVEMTRLQASGQGLLSESEMKWQKEQEEKQAAGELKIKERRERLRKMQTQNEMTRTEVQIAADAASKAKQLLVTMSQGPRAKYGDMVGGAIEQVSPEITGQGAYSRGMQWLGLNEARGVLESYITTLQGRVGLQKMMELKQASATGSTGFGALNQKELELLTGIMGDIDVMKMTPDVLYDKISTIESLLNKASAGFMPGDQQMTDTGQKLIFLGGDPDDIANWEVF